MLPSNVLQRIQDSSPDSIIYVGADSSVHKNKKTKLRTAKYVSMIILHHGGNSGASFLHTNVEVLPCYDLKSRLLYEAHSAISLAMEVIDHLDGRKLEVHFDLNPDPNHRSSVAVKEAIGYATGMGLTAKVKPESFAASHAADHLT